MFDFQLFFMFHEPLPHLCRAVNGPDSTASEYVTPFLFFPFFWTSSTLFLFSPPARIFYWKPALFANALADAVRSSKYF
jgi:hypothetical protein